MKKIQLICCICILCISSTYSQDEHFIRYDFTPTFFNPANTGSFYGTFRIGGLYREQARTWFSAKNPGLPEPVKSTYTTPSVFIDANFGLGFSAGDWTSFGLTAINDKSGDGALSNSSYMLNAAYHWSLDKKRRNVLTIGGQYGSNTITIDSSDFITETLILGGSLDHIKFANFNESYRDVNAGVTLVSKIGKNSKLDLGFAIGHLLPSSFSFQNDSIASVQNDIDKRFNAHAKLRFLATNGIALEPVLYFSSTAGATNIQLHLNSAFSLNENTALTAGIGYRLGDAVQILLGMNFGQWKVGMGYDLTVSDALDANSSVGGYELGLSRIFFRNKKPKIDPILLCPRL